MTERPTAEQVAAEPTGRRLDAWVAEYVTGWQPSGLATDLMGVPFPEECPHYSTDPGAAWAVVEQMRAADWSVLLMDSISGVGWRCGFVAPPDRKHGGYADTMPVAVCRAAVRAVIGD